MRRLWKRGYRPLTSPAQPPEPAGAYPVALLLAGAAGIGIIGFAASMAEVSASPLTWFLTRAAGFTLYLLLWLSVVLGLGITTKRFDRYVGRSIVYSLHGYVVQLSYGFLAMHLLALVADSKVPFGLENIMVPFGSGGPEPWTGVGVVAMWLMIAIALSVPFRRWISFRVWRGFHMLAFPLYVLALAHGIGAGSDTNQPWATALYFTTGLSVLFLTLHRLLRWNKRWQTASPVSPSPPFERFAAAPVTTPSRTRRRCGS
jgi:sulfoxide reductase heme-binding subunit YedZ